MLITQNQVLTTQYEQYERMLQLGQHGMAELHLLLLRAEAQTEWEACKQFRDTPRLYQDFTKTRHQEDTQVLRFRRQAENINEFHHVY